MNGRCFIALVAAVASVPADSVDPAKLLVEDLEHGKISRIEIFVAPDELESSVALNPEGLLARAKRIDKKPTDRAEAALLLSALRNAQLEKAPPDSRWGFLHLALKWGARFYSDDGHLRHELFLDQFGHRGTIQGRPYSFDDQIVAWFSSAGHASKSHSLVLYWTICVGVVAVGGATVLLFRRRRRSERANL